MIRPSHWSPQLPLAHDSLSQKREAEHTTLKGRFFQFSRVKSVFDVNVIYPHTVLSSSDSKAGGCFPSSLLPTFASIPWSTLCSWTCVPEATLPTDHTLTTEPFRPRPALCLPPSSRGSQVASPPPTAGHANASCPALQPLTQFSRNCLPSLIQMMLGVSYEF